MKPIIARRMLGFLICFLSMFCLDANAAEFFYGSVLPKGRPNAVILHGTIMEGDMGRLRAFIEEDPKRFLFAPMMVLASNGGSVEEAMKIGDFVRSTYSTVFVSSRIGKCVSACFLIYVSAIDRDSTIEATGVHRPYLPSEQLATMSMEKAEMQQKLAFTKMRDFLREREVPQDLQERMFTLASSEVYWLNEEDLNRIGRRANWYDQLVVAKCKVDKKLEQGYLHYGDAYAYADAANAQMVRVSTCQSELSFESRLKALARFLGKN